MRKEIRELLDMAALTKPPKPVVENGEIMVPDLDYLDRFPNLRHWQIFPTQPNRYKQAFAVLSKMAQIRRHRPEFSELYAELPPWAQWRERYNIQACVRPGMRFQKRAPRRKKS